MVERNKNQSENLLPLNSAWGKVLKKNIKNPQRLLIVLTIGNLDLL